MDHRRREDRADLQVRPRGESRFADNKNDVVAIGAQAAEGQDLKRLLVGFHQLLLKAVVVQADGKPMFGGQDQSVLSAERPNAFARHHLVVGDAVGGVAWLAGVLRSENQTIEEDVNPVRRHPGGEAERRVGVGDHDDDQPARLHPSVEFLQDLLRPRHVLQDEGVEDDVEGPLTEIGRAQIPDDGFVEVLRFVAPDAKGFGVEVDAGQHIAAIADVEVPLLAATSFEDLKNLARILDRANLAGHYLHRVTPTVRQRNTGS
jgi:hypothetical protein